MAKKTRPPIYEPPKNAHNMLLMAKSDLSIARAGKKSDQTRYETLCTSCQQAIEKSFKALMIHHNIPYPPEHPIDHLITYMENKKIVLPNDIKTSALAVVTIEGGFSFPFRFPLSFGTEVSLSEYAGNRRYSISDEGEPDEQEYKNVLSRVETVVNWVEQQIQK
ncbi:MAG: HEPN domain-containing protein [Methanoregula sp.]|nr:HEPN domain-containing protein [Methanoregula sp.]